MKNATLARTLFFLGSVLVFTGCTTIPEDKVFDEHGIYQNLPSGLSASTLIKHSQFLNARQINKSGARSSSAIAISKNKLGWAYLAWDYRTAGEAKRAALRLCNINYGDCHLYAVNGVIVFNPSLWRE